MERSESIEAADLVLVMEDQMGETGEKQAFGVV
jgi:hypothetical protein